MTPLMKRLAVSYILLMACSGPSVNNDVVGRYFSDDYHTFIVSDSVVRIHNLSDNTIGIQRIHYLWNTVRAVQSQDSALYVLHSVVDSAESWWVDRYERGVKSDSIALDPGREPLMMIFDSSKSELMIAFSGYHGSIGIVHIDSQLRYTRSKEADLERMFDASISATPFYLDRRIMVFSETNEGGAYVMNVDNGDLRTMASHSVPLVMWYEELDQHVEYYCLFSDGKLQKSRFPWFLSGTVGKLPTANKAVHTSQFDVIELKSANKLLLNDQRYLNQHVKIQGAASWHVSESTRYVFIVLVSDSGCKILRFEKGQREPLNYDYAEAYLTVSRADYVADRFIYTLESEGLAIVDMNEIFEGH